MHFHSAVVVNETQLPKLTKKETLAGARGADHVGQCVLADLRNDRLRLAFFPLVGQQHHLIVANFGKNGLRIERRSSCSDRGPFDFLAWKESYDSACFRSQYRSPFIHTYSTFSTQYLLPRSATQLRRCRLVQGAWILIMGFQTSAVHDLNSLTHCRITVPSCVVWSLLLGLERRGHGFLVVRIDRKSVV